MENVNSKKLACIIARIADDKLGKNISFLNISNVSSLADYFVLVTGDSTPQVRALTEDISKRIKDLFSRLPVKTERDSKNRWNLLDYGEVVVHIMHTEQREMYKIEKFWSHALTLDREKWEENSKEYSVYEK